MPKIELDRLDYPTRDNSGSRQEKVQAPRRGLVRNILGVGGVATAGISIPPSWTLPIVNAIVLPAHAQTTLPAPRLVDPCNLSISCTGVNPVVILSGSIDQPIPNIAIFGSVETASPNGTLLGGSGPMNTVTDAAGQYIFPNWLAPIGSDFARAATGITGASGPGSTATCEVTAATRLFCPFRFSLTCSMTATSPVNCAGNNLDIIITGVVSSTKSEAEVGVAVSGSVDAGRGRVALPTVISGAGGRFTFRLQTQGNNVLLNPTVAADIFIIAAGAPSAACMATVACPNFVS